jgi:hypothetical protein
MALAKQFKVKVMKNYEGVSEYPRIIAPGGMA